VEWLKVKVLSSNPVPKKKKKRERKEKKKRKRVGGVAEVVRMPA
jgi:hypothetical protein